MLIKTKTAAIACGRIGNIKEIQTRSGKVMATFGIAYESEQNDMGDYENKYINCAAFGGLAEFVLAIKEKGEYANALVAGKLKEDEYKGERREQIIVEFVSEQPKVKADKPKCSRQEEQDDDSDIPF